MDQFRADLHIHSRYSRATSKSLTPGLLAAWARIKGIDVLGTGDFTHPKWLEELETELVEDGSGLLVPRDPSRLDELVPWAATRRSGKVRFILQAEISSIYKRGGKVRKVHNLVFMPSLEAAKKFNQRLAQVGNLESDGRPILGLDSRNLLEMVLETAPGAFLVPAHIWTPWFSLFGSKSGFDSMAECFGDLSREVFALETGLSSDPEMNWLLSALDRFRLISNSDAHSGEKLGRELNVFSGERSYGGIYRALRNEGVGDRFLGTVEFFPEEGKYHMDGHRKCGVVLNPRETMENGGLCPVCGQPLTVGVLNRVLALADRTEPVQPAGQPGFTSLIPLMEVLGEILDQGPSTKAVKGYYGRLVGRFGSELAVLQEAPLEELGKDSPVLAEAMGRMRRGQVLRQPGYDGEYGTISVFTPQERREIRRGGSLVAVGAAAPLSRGQGGAGAMASPGAGIATRPVATPLAREPETAWNEAQQAAIEAGPGPVLVVAGPGTGKTQTLLGRILHLLDKGENPRHILAVTFTRRASAELKERLILARGGKGSLPRADTLHALAFEYWKTARGQAPVLLSEEGARRTFAAANPTLPARQAKAAWEALALCRERLQDPGEHAQEAQRYARQKKTAGLADYTDLLEYWLSSIRSGAFKTACSQVLVDEVQDLSRLQLEVVKGLARHGGLGFFAIGDPNQSIYSFRGALADVRQDIVRQWPDTRVVTLDRNYRSRQGILDVSGTALGRPERLEARNREPAEVTVFSAPTDGREAVWLAGRIKKLLGATSHTAADREGGGSLSPGDIAVLVRFRALIPPLVKALARLGVPCAAPEAEAFWTEPRVALILQAAGRSLGVAPEQAPEQLPVPDKVLAQGPMKLAAYLQEIPPFDRLFWQSQQFKRLEKGFGEHGGWGGLLTWVNLQSELDLVRQKAEKVQVMTIHASKGLEFEAVFLPALEDGILPFFGNDILAGKPQGSVGDKPAEEEELRLLYVGMTRAKSILSLSHAGRRELYGRPLQLPASRFLQRLPDQGVRQASLKARKVVQEKPLTLL